MVKRFLSPVTWLTVLMGSAIPGLPWAGLSVAWATEDQIAVATPAPTLVQAMGAVPAPATAPIIIAGPVYAYGPVLQSAKPRQRVRRPNWTGRDANPYRRDNGGDRSKRIAKPYRGYPAPDYGQVWQYGPPAYNWNPRWTTAPYRYGSGQNRWANPGPNPGPGQTAWSRSPNSSAFADYNRSGRAVDARDRDRQPYWRY